MSNITDTTNSLFDLLPVEATANILSFVNAKDHESVAKVSTLFNAIVNSGAEEGKNAREYLLGKIKKIDLTITLEDLKYLYMKELSTLIVCKSLAPSQQNSYFAEVLEILFPLLDNTILETLDNFKKAAIENIKKFLLQDNELTNLKLAHFVKDPNSEESQAFIKDLALKTLAKIIPNLKPEEREELGIELPKPTAEDFQKILTSLNKYDIQYEQNLMIAFKSMLLFMNYYHIAG